MVSTRSSALIQIMQIEDEIKKVRKSSRYKRIQLNLQKLRQTTGRAVIEVENPDQDDKMVTVRRNSKESKEFQARYQHQLDEYEVLINELGKKKKNLTTELFD